MKICHCNFETIGGIPSRICKVCGGLRLPKRKKARPARTARAAAPAPDPDAVAESFTISHKQMKKLVAWQKQFAFVPLGTIGGSYTYSFTPTTLGVVVRVKNNANGKELDISEYEDW
jgi:hypothetical protein